MFWEEWRGWVIGDPTTEIVDIGGDAVANIDKGHKTSDSRATNTASVRILRSIICSYLG